MAAPTHFIIPDCHAHPDHDNKRFVALGRMIAELRPERVICIGDFADMPSLSLYDRGKKSFEGRRYKRDVAVALDAQEKLFAGISKARNYNPSLYMFLGNHEARIGRATQEDAKLDGTIGVADLKYEEHGWKVYPFQEPGTIDGINYCHYFVTGVMGRAIGGENIGKTMCNKLHASAVQGHSHILDHSERATASGNKIIGISVGCYTHPEMIEDWNRATVAMWWRGVVLLEQVDGSGYYDAMHTITQRKVLREFA